MTQQLRAVGGKDDPLLTVPEAAEYSGLSESTIWVMIRNRQIESIGIPSARGRGERKQRRIRRSVLDKFLREHTEPAEPAAG